MASRLRVQLASPRSDRPQWVAVGAVAAGGLVGGLLLTAALGRSLRTSDASAAEPAAVTEPVAERSEPARAEAEQAVPNTPAAEPAPPSGPAEPERSVQVAENVENVADNPADAAVAAPAETAVPAGPEPVVAATETAAPIATTSSTHELVHGNIAYLRCEGVPLGPGPFPCPRDKRLERKVWEALEALTRCPLPADGQGDVELRIEFRTRGRRSFEVRPANESAAFASAASTCLAAGLEPIRTQLHPILMTVAFRFELR